MQGGGFDSFYSRTRAQIDELVKEDPTALYSYGDYNKAAKTLKRTVMLRGQSVEGQLDGAIPSTKNEQQKHPELLINGDFIDVYSMGSDSIMEEMDEGDWDEYEEEMSESEWEKQAKSFMAKQEKKQAEIIKHNAIEYGILLAVLIGAIIAGAQLI